MRNIQEVINNLLYDFDFREGESSLFAGIRSALNDDKYAFMTKEEARRAVSKRVNQAIRFRGRNESVGCSFSDDNVMRVIANGEDGKALDLELQIDTYNI